MQSTTEVIHSPPSSANNPSPAKRPRLALPPFPLLPLPLLLTTFATVLHRSAVALQPILALPPTSSEAYNATWKAYVEYESKAILCLRRVINGEAGDVSDKDALKARILLVELLERVEGGNVESEKVIARGIAIAQKHETLSSSKHHLYSLQASLSSTTNPKFARTLLKRAISELSTSPSTPSPRISHPQWLYTHLFTLSSMSDYPGALIALREVEKWSEERGDEQMRWAVKVLIIRLALGAREVSVARGLLEEVGSYLGLSGGEVKEVGGEEMKEREGTMSRQLRIQFVLMFCLYHTEYGNVKLARESLKKAHQLLDEKDVEEGEAEGWIKIPIKGGENKNGQTTGEEVVAFQLTPRPLLYGFAFLVSVAVHRDPFGSKPRSILFADEGLKMMDAKLKGAEALSPALAPADVLPALKSIAKMKVHLHLFLASLHLMRSSFPLAASHAASALRTSRQYPGLWEVFQVRIVLIKGLLAQALDDNERAIKCFEVCIAIAGSQVEGTLAKVSILILKISAGATVRLSSSASTPASAESTYLSSLASSIIQISQQPSSPPSLVFLGEFVQALTKGEITKAKQHLSNALNGANAQGANHAKALMLALLGNLFACTRNDQAQKMLLASYHISRGMGSRQDLRSQDQKDADALLGKASDSTVGNARLGLWLGQRLLESYEAGAGKTYRGRDEMEAQVFEERKKEEGRKAREQVSLNEAHMRVLHADLAYSW